MNISDDYITGFVEGEGMFYVGIVPSRETKSSWQVIYFFKVSQNPSGKIVLEGIRKRLDCGYIKENSKVGSTDKTLAYVVRDLKSIQEKVIPFFDRKLIIKKDAFDKFTKVIKIVSGKNHLKRSGITKILDISYRMNTSKRRYSKEEILKCFPV